MAESMLAAVQQAQEGCVPRDILTNVVVATVTQEETLTRSFRVFTTVEGIVSCQVETVESAVIVGSTSWRVLALFRLTVVFMAGGTERTLRALVFFQKTIPFPPDIFPEFSRLPARVQIQNLSCDAHVGDGQRVIVAEIHFTVVVLPFQEQVLTVCELVPES